jgi:hypothetical protein
MKFSVIFRVIWLDDSNQKLYHADTKWFFVLNVLNTKSNNLIQNSAYFIILHVVGQTTWVHAIFLHKT